MFDGYPTRVALTSLVLLGTLAALPRPSPAPGCPEIARLYSRRALQELRADLRLAYAVAAQRREQLVLEVLRHERSIDALVRIDHVPLASQDTGDRRRKLLLDYVIAHCMPR